jgi:hypothetical protein
MQNSISRPLLFGLPLWVVALACVAVLMLIATIFYPFGYDQAVFSVGGQLVMKGAVPYRDFLDTKPPAIFYLYGAAIWLFGRHEWSIHLFDIIYQIASAFYFFRILRRTLNYEVAVLAVSLTLILYAGSGFWMTAEAESFALLPSLLLIDMTTRAVKKDSSSVFYFGLLAGVAAFALVLLKFTFVFGAIAAMLYVLLRRELSARTKLSYFAGMMFSSAILSFASIYELKQTGALEPFLQSLHWLSDYASIVTKPFLELILVVFPLKIVYSASVSIIILGSWGIVSYIRSRRSDNIHNPLLGLLALTFIFQLAGVCVERKIEFPYQYTRALWAITPFAAAGLIKFVGFVCDSVASRKILKGVISVLLMAVAIAFSPLVRIYSQTAPWTITAISSKDAAVEVERRIPDYYPTEQRSATSYMSKKMSASDQLFFWGNDVGVYSYANKLPQTICLTATPLRTDFTPPEWKDKLLRQLTDNPPKYFVVEYGDALPYITGSKLDSYGSLFEWGELSGWLTANYISDTTIGRFLIFSKR